VNHETLESGQQAMTSVPRLDIHFVMSGLMNLEPRQKSPCHRHCILLVLTSHPCTRNCNSLVRCLLENLIMIFPVFMEHEGSLMYNRSLPLDSILNRFIQSTQILSSHLRLFLTTVFFRCSHKNHV